MDEYLTLRELDSGGVSFLLTRITEWSYRPFSEGLVFLYSLAVASSGSQLITHFLGGLWLILLLLLCLPVLLFRSETGLGNKGAALMLVLTVMVLFLGSRAVAEVFYWPQGSAAYLPALACLGFVTFSLALSGRSGFGEVLALTLMLAVLALSTEVGAMISACFVGAFLVLAVLDRWKTKERGVLASSDFLLIIVLLAALPVFYFVLNGRMSGSGEVFGNPEIAKNIGRSLWEALKKFPTDGLGLRYTPDRPVWFFATLLAKVLLFAGALGLFRQLNVSGAARSQRQVVSLFAWLAALMAGSLFSLVAAFYQFGVVCCERHQTTRDCLAVLAIVVVARIVAMILPGNGGHRSRISPVALLAGATLLVAFANAPALLHDYKSYSRAWNARNETWMDGRSDEAFMIFRQPPILRIAGGQNWEVGQYERQEEPTLTIRVIMDYFGKTRMDMRPVGEPSR
ncbi:hypothetical protein JYU29_05915 [Tianweitania sp. BSSL-BM11]|uniref:DUF4173 domain-containing protein n=1 Tax=Tianweitania aestuarii TaxID=2814886 RepID=A0ABS5RT89_9HYPH|nr:hypothetical protein [Tianweitania aestuarii]MBS9720221.1 hypothetical protein [Tianweitania aestuarii]